MIDPDILIEEMKLNFLEQLPDLFDDENNSLINNEN